MQTVPLISHTLTRQDGSAIQNAAIAYGLQKSGVAGFNVAAIGAAIATTDSSGVATVAVPADSYTRQIGNTPSDAVVGEHSPVSYATTVNGNGEKIYHADKYTFDVTSNVSLDSVTLEIYQTDAAGKINRGTGDYVVQPMGGTIAPDVRAPLVFTKTRLPGAAQSTSIDAELFEGTYRVALRATATNASTRIATYISPVITVTGQGAIVPTPVTLTAESGNELTVILNDHDAAPLEGRNISFRDRSTRILLDNKITNANGVASVMVGTNLSNVIAEVSDAANTGTVAVYQFNNISTTSTTVLLRKRTITGRIAPVAGAALDNSAAIVGASLNTGLGVSYDRDNLAGAVLTSADGSGTYSIDLFGAPGAGLSYKLRAANVTDMPDVTALQVTVADSDLTEQNITVAPGGLILGKITDEDGSDLAGVTVAVYRIEADGKPIPFSEVTTDSNGEYTAKVAYGKYLLLVNGAVSDGIVISSADTTFIKNIKRYHLSGRITKNQEGTAFSATSATVYAGTQSAVTDGNGVYSLTMMEGKNWICARPSTNDVSFGYTCKLNILVNDASVAATRQQ
ncbi:MAG TPA: hypothetical protein VGE50_10780 [Gammaproteobacteria bacterium]